MSNLEGRQVGRHARTHAHEHANDLQDRKARKVNKVMGCELRRQLSEPGAGDCCDSMARTNKKKKDKKKKGIAVEDSRRERPLLQKLDRHRRKGKKMKYSSAQPFLVQGRISVQLSSLDTLYTTE